MTVQIVIFSGGRTSAYLVHLMEKRRTGGEDIRYIFMDTGAEHPGTYDFVRNVVKHWQLNLICLRVVVNPELGKGNGYKVVSVDEIGPDLQPWRDVCAKYGTPYVHGAFCTRTMKLEPFERYCKDHFESYHTWIGIRYDEPKRLKERENVSYLADISDFDKQDVLAWWKTQSFDLEIPEHNGNCVFCVKKGINKIALAARDNPETCQEFMELITSDSVRVVDRRQQENKIMYRGNHSLESIIAMFSEHSREEIAATIRGGGGYDTGSCTESCEVFSCDIADDAEEVAEAPKISTYCSKLTELREKPTHLLKEVGDQWRTPDALFWGINAMFGPLVLDLFTDGDNSKCPAFYTAEDNALTQDWSARLVELHGAAFGNPPYSRAQQHEGQYITGMQHIMAHAMDMRERGGRYVFLIKAATSETWWPEQADHVAFIRGRVGFDVPQWFVPADEKQVPTGAFFAGAIVIFDKSWSGPAMSYISRTQLETMGAAFVAQIRREAERLLPHIQPQNIPEYIPGREVAA
ncbi:MULTISPECIES: phage N-6-adenine-methyltransferase [Serratia]|uniref:phage N-6-adenine-methyltransferase n=1 Tax=Serratia TaxID=613 RepID=UPI000AD847AE|nr:phage N-6-adenine-methyltransferase [Serratia sp. HMSC15F11]WLS21703.1 phage N-6-adenine-methyltransferase [Serratia marcescens]CAI1926274.1 PUA domain (predicted RNA-binding domain) [Serratia marcescens]CAI1970017.1 PUA domain (predicted RNA-binding domain) [Serratia marcescens]CAI1975618.1 PUA domain (predicted RNA-binding domain) [Serratia marcescens]CAI1979128.1 PUA domain (predicted RNA-binding domain) [Serratia marcescens]